MLLSDTEFKARQTAVELFRGSDEDSNGRIDAREFPSFYQGLVQAGLVAPNKDETVCLEELDTDKDGEVTLNEYINWLHDHELDRLELQQLQFHSLKGLASESNDTLLTTGAFELELSALRGSLAGAVPSSLSHGITSLMEHPQER
eukprot:CAMPEP_0175122818 /NCGR_PEP_ID=MMETSP0087-20121206/1915_1 /TAXON_ID=136419 /ORGANISM="Unknown Unknown, Strain D1" /LENGTH=145 /DNA_ID=CAMNT_0016404473 /DNA_START=126 /DNA_END=563 /DNA_ORIENTATION=-